MAIFTFTQKIFVNFSTLFILYLVLKRTSEKPHHTPEHRCKNKLTKQTYNYTNPAGIFDLESYNEHGLKFDSKSTDYVVPSQHSYSVTYDKELEIVIKLCFVLILFMFAVLANQN